MSYREEIQQAMFDQDFEEADRILNVVLKDESIPATEYQALVNHCKKRGFSFAKHFNVIVV